MTPRRAAVYAGAASAAIVIGWMVYRKASELASPARTAQIEAQVSAVAEREATAYLLARYGLTPSRISAVESFANRLQGRGQVAGRG